MSTLYPNLRAELARRGIAVKRLNNLIADHVQIAESTLSQKINGRSDFTLEEAIAIKGALETDLPLETLFKRW